MEEVIHSTTDLIVLSYIPRLKAQARKGLMLCSLTGLSRRDLKKSITRLRKTHPIVSRETDGGGYWIAECQEDVDEYKKMIARRKRGYEETLETMSQFEVNGYDYEK